VADESFETILAAAEAGAEWAWADLITPIAPKLIGFFRGRGARDPEALAGEVLLQVARSISAFSGDRDAFTAWVFVIAYRRLIDDRRRTGRRVDERLTSSPPEPRGTATSAEDMALARIDTLQVETLLAPLTQAQRDVIYLRVIADLSIEETSQALGRPVSAIKSLQRRGLRTLQREITRQEVSP
jgi:RNA polymerase sigma-70 factor (ECF subfamily)